MSVPIFNEQQKRHIFTISNVQPEAMSYAMAAFSRSRKSLAENIKIMTGEKAADFLETFYFKYGHKSIADMAHIPMALENITMLDAIEVVWENLWDGQERSSRYQDFKVTGYTVPDEIIADDDNYHDYVKQADELFDIYDKVTQVMTEYYTKNLKKPAEMDEKDYERTVRARAFDVARYFLPLCTNTSVGQIVSARTLEGQISRLLSSPYPTVRRVAEGMRKANQSPSFTPTGYNGEPTAPTLVKYTEPLEYMIDVYREFSLVAEELVEMREDLIYSGKNVELVIVDDPIDQAISKLLYSVSNYPYSVLVQVVRDLSQETKQRLLWKMFRDRGRHDQVLREFKTGTLNFDIFMDIGGFRDLHRHRATQQYRQRYSTYNEYFIPDVIEEADPELYDAIVSSLEYNLDIVDSLNGNSLEVPGFGTGMGDYLLPLAHGCRTLFTMDLAEAIYIIELRTRPSGHFSYRNVAYRMYEELIQHYPQLKDYIRAVKPEEDNLLER